MAGGRLAGVMSLRRRLARPGSAGVRGCATRPPARRNGFARVAVGACLATLALALAACSSAPASPSRSTSTTPGPTSTSTSVARSTTTTSATTTSATTTTTTVGPAGGPIPQAFQATSFTAVSLHQWWVSGTARCLTGFGTCAAILRTTDGGAGFVGIPSPPVALGAVSQLRFANALDGYAFGPGLWETADGGSTWVAITMPGQVTELEAADGEAYALVTATDSSNSTSTELMAAAVGSGPWHQVATPSPLGFGAQFTVSGPNLYVLGGNGSPDLWYSADQGAQFSQRVDPCTAGLGGSLSAAADGTPTLWAACTTGTMAQGMRSTNGGVTWQVATAAGGFPNSLRLAAATASVALASPVSEGDSGALARTTNGGSSFSVVLPGSSASAVTWAGFSDPANAYAILTGSLFESSDGGATWRAVVFRS